MRLACASLCRTQMRRYSTKLIYQYLNIALSSGENEVLSYRSDPSHIPTTPSVKVIQIGSPLLDPRIKIAVHSMHILLLLLSFPCYS